MRCPPPAPLPVALSERPVSGRGTLVLRGRVQRGFQHANGEGDHRFRDVNGLKLLDQRPALAQAARVLIEPGRADDLWPAGGRASRWPSPGARPAWFPPAPRAPGRLSRNSRTSGLSWASARTAGSAPSGPGAWSLSSAWSLASAWSPAGVCARLRYQRLRFLTVPGAVSLLRSRARASASAS